MSIEETVTPPVNMNYAHLLQGGRVTELCNPITRYWAKLVPNFELDPDAGLEDLAKLQWEFYRFCEKAWDSPARRSPLLVNPYAILDGSEPVETLDSTIERLVDEYGIWPVYAAAEARKLGVTS